MQEYRNRENRGDNFRQAIKHTTFYYAKRVVFSGLLVTGLLLLAQIGLLILMFVWVSNYAHLFFEGYTLFGVVCMILIINDDTTPEYKIAWMIPIAIFPIVGSLMFLYLKYNIGTIAPRKVLQRITKETSAYTYTNPEVKTAIHSEHTDIEKLSDYLEKNGGCCTYSNSSMEYFSLGDDVVDTLVEELKKAKEFIFIEFFMIEEGIFFNQILEILTEKVKEGVEVRVMYDDLGCVVLLPRKYSEKLKCRGINVRTYAHLTPFLSTHYNNRDHRKILVVDGKFALSGGINLCDEYINAYEKFGHWKDNAYVVRGEAVKSFTLMFLQMWNSVLYRPNLDYEKYLITYPIKGRDGYIIPYGDGPHQDETVAKNVYMDILNNAKDYVYIMTPYLILDHEMESTISHAAMSGIDVRIILPHIPDKKIPFSIARTYYPKLLHAGVKIYEYEPGFIHSKTFLSDDKIGVVGTINLDYRSLYLHYECAGIFYKCDGLKDIKNDFTSTFAKCIEVDIKYYHKINIINRFFGRIWSIFGPLM